MAGITQALQNEEIATTPKARHEAEKSASWRVIRLPFRRIYMMRRAGMRFLFSTLEKLPNGCGLRRFAKP